MEGKRMSGLLEVKEENVHKAEQEKKRTRSKGFFLILGDLIAKICLLQTN